MNQELFRVSLIVGLGGFVGTTARFVFGSLIEKIIPASQFPLGTLTVNIIGCFLIGMVAGFSVDRISSDSTLFLFITVGLLGGFTTFSAFAYEAQLFFQIGELFKLSGYVLLQVLTGIAMAFFGYTLFKG
ncbi:MAG: fluoride efflux transporter CrcB [Acidobacteriia bacterium]|jgi:CrcB protein|nr:fluoride efflux transporter CrcB [Terriglobia bacterium]